MKKLLSIMITVVLCALCLPCRKVDAESGGSFVYTGSGFDMDAFLREFSTDYANRSAITPGMEYAAAQYIAGVFKDIGLNVQSGEAAGASEDYISGFNFSYLGTEYASHNVTGVLTFPESGGKTVIIGAHYDNVHDYTLTNPYTRINYNTLSNGAYDNGSGIAAMISVAYSLKDYAGKGNTLPFNVVFAAFGAEETGMYGSREFVQKMSRSEKENTLLMLDFDSISAGDYLYLFSKDWQTGYDGYLRNVAKELNVPLKSMPFDKKYMQDPFGTKLYSHTGYYSDNYYFLDAGINTAIFMSLNLESKKKAGVVESDSVNDIMHTSDDNYTKLTELYPGYLLKMQYVSETVTKTLTREGFAAAMLSSEKNEPDYFAIMSTKHLTVAAIILWLGFSVAAYLYYAKLKKVSNAKVKEYLSDPKNAEKINFILGAFKNVPPPPGFTYPPDTYKPKKEEDNFSVFGKDYENPDRSGGKDNKNGSGDNGDSDNIK